MAAVAIQLWNKLMHKPMAECISCHPTFFGGKKRQCQVASSPWPSKAATVPMERLRKGVQPEAEMVAKMETPVLAELFSERYTSLLPSSAKTFPSPGETQKKTFVAVERPRWVSQ
ncbi:hypothetical protein OUZ56_016202 [Daphnia magna]|uniref:Uncharacterized protein n=1 Tax=Daphnia magna TaxID=35525 RepID=A0ABR0AQ37_9CRUS|nr:hypothetical protein OUZ56_016202 [Daphnia magna]